MSETRKLAAILVADIRAAVGELGVFQEPDLQREYQSVVGGLRKGGLPEE